MKSIIANFRDTKAKLNQIRMLFIAFCLTSSFFITVMASAFPQMPIDSNQVYDESTSWSGSPSLDSTFGDKGIITNRINNNSINEINDLVVQADGNIVVAGYTRQSVKEISADKVLIRYLPNGDIDTSFGLNGIVTTTMKPKEYEWKIFNSILLQDDGNIITVGQHDSYFSISRYLNDGNLDSSFGQGPVPGIITSTLGTARDIVQQPDKKLIATGIEYTLNGDKSWSRSIFLTRYLQNGSLDTSFGFQGIVTTTLNQNNDQSIVKAITLQDDGKILVAGIDDLSYRDQTLKSRPALVRYHTDGQLDTAFGNMGIITETLQMGASFNDVVIQADRKILAAGYGYDASLDTVVGFIIRYDTNGIPDPTFANNGTLLLFGSGFSDITLLDDGKILAAAGAKVIVYESDGSLSKFWGKGWVTIINDPYSGNITNEVIAILDNGKIITAGYHRITSSQRDFSVSKYVQTVPTAYLPILSP